MFYTFNTAVTVSPASSTGQRSMVLCEVPAGPQDTRRYVVPDHLVQMLQLFDGRSTIAEVVERFQQGEQQRYSYDASSVTRLVEHFCAPAGILTSSSPSMTSGAAAYEPARYLTVKIPLLPHAIVYPVARALGFLFWPPLITLLIIASFALRVYFYRVMAPRHDLSLSHVTASHCVEIFGITILAALFHEFGHAGALALHECKKTGIGLGWYLYVPVLYTDVSEAWRLKPMERVRVDIGGMYFQSIAQMIALLLFAVTHSVVFLYAIIPIDISIASSLNPFLRMDGYWLVADAFGIWNPRKQSLMALKRLWRKLWRRTEDTQRSLPEPAGASWIVLLYTGLSILFFTYLTVLVGSQLLRVILPQYPGLWVSFVQHLRYHAADDPFTTLRIFVELALKTLLLCGCSLIVWRALRKILSWVSFPVRKFRVRNDGVTGVRT